MDFIHIPPIKLIFFNSSCTNLGAKMQIDV